MLLTLVGVPDKASLTVITRSTRHPTDATPRRIDDADVAGNVTLNSGTDTEIVDNGDTHQHAIDDGRWGQNQHHSRFR